MQELTSPAIHYKSATFLPFHPSRPVSPPYLCHGGRDVTCDKAQHAHLPLTPSPVTPTPRLCLSRSLPHVKPRHQRSPLLIYFSTASSVTLHTPAATDEAPVYVSHHKTATHKRQGKIREENIKITISVIYITSCDFFFFLL